MTFAFDLSSGNYPLEIGLNIVEMGQRLQVVQQDGMEGDVLGIRPLTIPKP
ncbi:MAG: hypothetical protein GY943_19895 [Chloroflexi bacterium]|nr:hypothetical protein [Chloroflexota bacterium]